MEPIDLAPQVVRHQVTVGFGGDPRIAVTEDSLHGAWVHARHHEQARRRVPEIVESDSSHLGLGPELHSVARAVPQLVIRHELGMTASTLAADVFPPFDDPRVSECAPKNVFEGGVAAQHLALGIGEQEPGRGGLHRHLEIRNKLSRDGDCLSPAALRASAIIGSAYDDQTIREVDIAFPQPEQLALSEPRVDSCRN
jgi:hypothetical protein